VAVERARSRGEERQELLESKDRRLSGGGAGYLQVLAVSDPPSTLSAVSEGDGISATGALTTSCLPGDFSLFLANAERERLTVRLLGNSHATRGMNTPVPPKRLRLSSVLVSHGMETPVCLLSMMPKGPMAWDGILDVAFAAFSCFCLEGFAFSPCIHLASPVRLGTRGTTRKPA